MQAENIVDDERKDLKNFRKCSENVGFCTWCGCLEARGQSITCEISSWSYAYLRKTYNCY